MSWQTPDRWAKASCAPVRTPVAPGTYSTAVRTKSATARAASCGADPVRSCTALATNASSTVVSGVAASISANRSLTAIPSSSAHSTLLSIGRASEVSTTLRPVTSRTSCSSCRSKAAT